MEEEYKTHLQAAFDKMDTDHDGKVNIEELWTFVTSLGRKMTEKECVDIVKTCNPTGKDMTFQQVMDKAPLFMRKLLTFIWMDKNGDKMVDFSEFKGMMDFLMGKDAMPDKDMHEAFNKVDLNHDGKVTFDEVLKIEW